MAQIKNRKLGVGVGYRPAWREFFLSPSPPDISWIEIISENFFRDGLAETRARQTLRLLRNQYPVAMHGVGLNLASAEPLNRRYLDELKELIGFTDPWLVTDHLCWTGLGGLNTFDLLPFPLNRESFTLVAEKVAQVQDFLGRSIALENITYYAEPRGAEMPEWFFLNELCDRTGCGVLLDINNIYVNSQNLGTDPMEFLCKIKMAHVREIHLAGHSVGRDGLLIDTHGAPVRNEVWDLYQEFLLLAGPLPTMIERDQGIPAWRDMEKELSRLKKIVWEASGKNANSSSAQMATSLS